VEAFSHNAFASGQNAPAKVAPSSPPAHVETTAASALASKSHASASRPFPSEDGATPIWPAERPHSMFPKAGHAKPAELKQDSIRLNGALEVDVPFGVPLPAAVLHASAPPILPTELDPAHQRIAEQQAEDFVRQVAARDSDERGRSSNARQTQADSLAWWRQATAIADERFRALVGHEAYNRAIIRQHQFNKPTLPTN
jgi:hypothetical protein